MGFILDNIEENKLENVIVDEEIKDDNIINIPNPEYIYRDILKTIRNNRAIKLKYLDVLDELCKIPFVYQDSRYIKKLIILFHRNNLINDYNKLYNNCIYKSHKKLIRKLLNSNKNISELHPSNHYIEKYNKKYSDKLYQFNEPLDSKLANFNEPLDSKLIEINSQRIDILKDDIEHNYFISQCNRGLILLVLFLLILLMPFIINK